MSKLIRNLLILAAVLIIIGGIVAGVGTMLGGFKPITITTNGPVIVGTDSADSVKVNENYSKITELKVDLDIGELILVEGDSFSLKGSYNPTLLNYEIIEKNGVLTIIGKSIKNGLWGWNWNWNWGFSGFATDRLTFTYPKGTEFDLIDVTLELGSLEINSLQVDSLILSLSLGDLKGNAISVDSLNATLNLGSCNLTDLTVSRQAEFNMDAGSLYLKNSSINNLTANNNLGSFDYSGTLKGNAKVVCDLGSLKMDLEDPENELSYSIKADLGSVTVNGRTQSSSVSKAATSPKCTLDLNASLGSITLNTR